MLPRLRQLFGRDIEIIPDLSPDTALVMADPVQVRQIILNLAANSLEAMEAMERGGTFCLQTGNSPTVESGLGNGARSLAGLARSTPIVTSGPACRSVCPIFITFITSMLTRSITPA